MIEYLYIENFKGFEKFSIDFDQINLLVGGNNSGKTTIFNALQTVFWCFDKTADLSHSEIVLRKTQLPEVGAFSYFDFRDIFYRQKLRTGRIPTRIIFKIKFKEIEDEYTFKIYHAFSRNLMIDGTDQKISEENYNKITKTFRPVYVPSTIGITPNEELYRTISQERLISEGRHNEVLRNQIYRLKQNPEIWEEFIGIIAPIFKLRGVDVPFDEDHDEWLSVKYDEDGCLFDCISAGSGFLQIINLLSFLFLHESRIALLDEPDSHMHSDLQQISFDLLKKLSENKNIQLLIATHSPVFIDASGLENVLVIDKNMNRPLRAENIEELIPLLSDQGISLPPTKIVDTLKSRRILFVENNEADYNDFFKVLGGKIRDDFEIATRELIVLETEGATKKWPFDAIDAFERLLGVPIKYIYISDRDFQIDQQIAELVSRIPRGKIAHYLNRRHRESYLCEPRVLNRLLTVKWERKYPSLEPPVSITEENIHDFFIQKAREFESETRSILLTQQESYIREERSARTREINDYFDENYSHLIARNEIPYKLLDCKKILGQFRKQIADECHFSFRDKEILLSFERDEIPPEICQIITDITDMFET